MRQKLPFFDPVQINLGHLNILGTLKRKKNNKKHIEGPINDKPKLQPFPYIFIFLTRMGIIINAWTRKTASISDHAPQKVLN